MLQLALYSRPQHGDCGRCASPLAESPDGRGYIVLLPVTIEIGRRAAAFEHEAHPVCGWCVTDMEAEAATSSFTCPGCAREFRVLPWINPPEAKGAKCCSDACSQRARRKRSPRWKTFACAQCGSSFKSTMRWAKYCNGVCKSRAANMAARVRQGQPKFKPASGHDPRRLNPDAVNARSRTPIERTCEQCEKPFQTRWINPARGRFCTRVCSSAFARAHKVTLCSEVVKGAPPSSRATEA